MVRCQHCGARYDTDLPVRAVERIRRCSRCGYPALETVPEGGEEEPAEAVREPDD
jgi:rRNA maturation protein Nop10